MASEDVYLPHRALIDRTIGAVCRRHRLISADAEEFASEVRLHLLDDDCAVLRRFEGRSSLNGYLTVVITHLYLDWRNARWGKWRPSAAARRQGPLAELLERLIVRDRLTFEQAYETLRTNFQVTESRMVLEAIASDLPVRPGRYFVSDDVLEHHASSDSQADASLRTREAADGARAARSALATAVAALQPRDRIVLKMRFEDGFAIADIARTLDLQPKPLYRQLSRMLDELRDALERSGLTAATAAAVLHEGGLTDSGDGVMEETSVDVRPLKGREPSSGKAQRRP